MSDDKENIDDLIRDGFDSSDEGFDFDSWTSMESKLNASTDIDMQIVQAFNQAPEELPSSVWPEIQEELDISTVWNRISQQLKRKKRRAFIWWNAAAVGLLLILAGYVFQDEIKSEFKANNEKQSDVKQNSNSTEIENSSVVENIQDIRINDANLNVENVQTESNYTSSTDWSYSDNFVANNLIENEVQGSIDSIGSNRNEIELYASNDIELIKPLSLSSINLIEYEKFDHEIPEIEINPVDQNKPLHPRKWIIGAFCSLDNGFISDATTRDALSSNSLNSNNFTLSINYGLYGQFYTKKNYFVQAEFYWNSRMKRSTQEYQHFQYVNNSLELDYYQLALSFGKSIPVGKDKKIWFNPSVGLFGSYLKHSSEYQEDMLITNNTSHKRWNYGFQVDLGIQHEFNRFTVGYGLHSLFGLENIFQGTEKQSSFLNVSRTFSNGFYLRLGFKI